MAKMGRPKTKEDTVKARVRVSDNARIVKNAAEAHMSVPDYIHMRLFGEGV